MPSVEIYTARDPLWVASMRARYRRMLYREHCAPGDDARLHEALQALKLTPADFEHDRDALERGETCDRVRGVWPDEPGYEVQRVEEDNAIEDDTI